MEPPGVFSPAGHKTLGFPGALPTSSQAQWEDDRGDGEDGSQSGQLPGKAAQSRLRAAGVKRPPRSCPALQETGSQAAAPLLARTALRPGLLLAPHAAP